MDAPNIGQLARVADVSIVVNPLEVLGNVQTLDTAGGNRGEGHVPLRRLLHGRLEHVTFPAQFVTGGSGDTHRSHYRVHGFIGSWVQGLEGSRVRGFKG